MRKSWSCIFLLTAVLIIAGCVKSPHVQFQIDESVAALIDREINCAEAPEGTCAIDSELHELAEHAFANSTTETPVHHVSILNNGQDALIARLHLIRSAKKTLELQTYIWTDDEVGRLVFFEFLQAARRGVKVRIIVDQFTMGVEPELLARLATAHENLEIGFYNPIFTRGKTTPLAMTTGALFSFRKYNQRMHNKVFIADGQIGIVGGRNIENSYYDYSTTYNFKDRDVLVIGPAVRHMRETFERYWNDEVVVKAVYLVDVGQEVVKLGKKGTPTLLKRPDISLFSDIDTIASQYSIFEDRPTSKPYPVGRVQYTADLPGKPQKNEEGYKDSSSTMREVIHGVQKSLTLQTPYFHLSRTAIKMLKKMRKNNPDLKLTVSSNSLAATDLVLNYAITMKQKRSIIKNLKVNLYEFKPYPGDVRKYIPRYDKLIADTNTTADSSEDMNDIVNVQGGPRTGLHAKSIVVDSDIAIIGSHNLNPRSAKINTESAVIIWDQEIARQLRKNILVDMEPQNSWVVAKKQQVPIISYFSNIMGSISSMLPVFDIWPFRYSSSFQLKEGMRPVPAGHPDFYKQYEDVGQFPEINLSSKAVQTRIMKSFGGFLAPFT